MPKTKPLTYLERYACVEHARDHIIEAIEEAMHAEHHSVMKVDGQPRPDMQYQTMRQLERFLQTIRSTRCNHRPLTQNRFEWMRKIRKHLRAQARSLNQ